LEENGFSRTREALQAFGQDVKDQYGYEGFLDWSIEHSPYINWNGPLVVDGLRHPVIYEKIMERFPGAILVYCDCDKETQIRRTITRDEITLEEAEKIISHQTEKYVSDLEAYAHIVYRPESSIEDVIQELDRLMSGTAANYAGPI
jgi:hypothetical protein